VDVTGENPTHDQPEGNDGVRLKGVHELDAYAFQEGKWHGLIVFNYGLHQARRLTLEAPGLSSHRNVGLWRLLSPEPGSTNEAGQQVTVKEDRFAGAGMLLPPCSMAVLEWQE
jgi:hypothetical protein